MSPASQGILEVERYIGSCLISSGCCKQEQPQHRNSQSKQQQQQQQSSNNQFWAGGAPLMQQQQQHNRVPLSRLAVHTQGAPLILSSQRYHNNNRQPKQPPAQLFNNLSRQQQQQTPLPQQQQRINKINATEMKKPKAEVAVTNNVASIDSLSIASDESSGSNNSENSLPRIIKPRKRRKKDRKPPVVQVTNTTKDNNNKDEIVPVSNPSVAVVQQQQPALLPTSNVQQTEPPRLRSYSYDNNHPRYADNYYRRAINRQAPINKEVIDTRQQQPHQRFAQQQQRHVQVKVLDDNRNVILPLCQKSNNGSYLRQQSTNNNNNRFYEASTLDDDCPAVQCRYCDPSTLIWDVADQASFPAQYLQATPMIDHHHRHHHHHRPHNHHHHHHRYAQVPVFLTARPIICSQELFDVATDNLRLRQQAAVVASSDGSALLRRSWSDPTSYFNDEIGVTTPNRDVGVIGDRGGQDTTSKNKNPWRGDALSCGSSSPVDQPSSPANSCDSGVVDPAPLHVSTEIVTSANGHRDLEIKFYSTSPTLRYSSSGHEDTSKAHTFAFPDDEDNEEFSDIWSYHESKLQQDFRTLLQAGED